MNILTVHNRYQIRGGEDEVFEEESDLLLTHGHVVSKYEKNNQELFHISPLRLAQKTLWSQETFNAIKEKLGSQTIDLVHVHNFLPLVSPSIYYAANAANVPIVQTLHNYRLLCPNGLFFRDGHSCEDCLDKPFPWPGIIHKCYKQNRLATATVASMLSTHRLLSTWSEKVDGFITLTEFARQKFIQGGIPAQKIFVKPNFVANDTGIGSGSGRYAIYVGRLSVEKGLDILLQVWTQFSIKLPLLIVGDGPLAGTVAQAVQINPFIKWIGRRPIDEVYPLLGSAMFMVFPSKWYEGMPRVVIESFSKGTPVIGAKLGAVGEIVAHQNTGLHFSPGNPEDLAIQVDWALSHEPELAEMRHAARAEFEAKYTAEANYAKLMEIYDSVTQRLSTPG